MRKTILFLFFITFHLFAFCQTVSLTTPSNNFVSDTTYVKFQWNKVAAASSYDLQIASDSLFTSSVVNITGIAGNTKNYSLSQSNAKYFWHIRYYNGSSYSSWSSYRKLIVFRPSDISGLTVWLRADKGVSQLSGRISSWQDKSSNSYSAVQGTSAKQPYQTTPDKLDGLKSVYYDGSNCLRIPSVNLSSTDAVSVFTFMKKKIVAGSEHTMYVTTDDIYSNNNGFYNIIQAGSGVNLIGVKGNGGYNQINCYNPIDTNYNVLSTVFNKTLDPEVYAYLNSSALTGSHAFSSYNTGNFTSVPFNIASFDQGSSFYYGEMPELILYTKEVSSGERNQITNYLENHYFPPVNLGFDTSLYSLQPYILNAGKRFSSYSWSTGATSSTLSVTKSGTYSVSADDVFGINSKDTVVINFPNTKLNFTNDTTICLGNSIQLRSMIYRARDYHLLWSTGSTDSTITVSTAGNYWLRISDTLGSPAVYSDTISINVDNFAQKVNLGNDTTFCLGNYIRIYPPLPNPQNLTFTWSDGTHNETLVVLASGKYKVTVTNQFGCSGKDSVYVNVAGTAPTTLFYADSVCLTNFTSFTDSTKSLGGPIVKWHWQLTSTDTSNLQNPTFIYNSAGIHNVTLTTYTNGGCSKSFSKNVIVYSQPSPAFSVDTACRNNPYQFVDQSSAVSGDIIVSWNWNFGDGTAHSNLPNPAHIYTHGNNYNVTLAVTTQNGCQKSVSHIIHVDSVSAIPWVPVINYPANNSLISDSNVTFSWYPAQYSIRYRIVIASDSGFNNIIANNVTDSSHFNKVFSNANQLIFWKVYSFNICSDSSVTQKQEFEIFSPREISGLKLWLKADAGITPLSGNKVDLWSDQSGGNNNAIQSNPSLRPVFVPNVLNGKPVVAFNGTTDRLDGTTINGIGDSSLTVLIVMSGNNSVVEDMGETPFGINNGLWIYRYTGNSSQNLIIGNNQPAATSLRSPGNSLLNSGFGFRIFCYEKNLDTISNLYFNGNFIVSSNDAQTNSGFSNSNYYVGNGGLVWQSALNGNIAEILLYKKFLSDSNRQRLERYLNFKYAGPPVNLGPDIVVNYRLCPITLDAGARFTDFLWSTGDTTQTITVQNSGTYSVTATNYFGVQSIDTIKIIKPSLHLSDTGLCLNTTLVLNSGLNNSYNFLWSDGTTAPIFSTAVPGKFWLTVTDSLGCWVRDTFNVVADSFPVKVSLGPDRNICQGELLGLSNGASEAIIYFWSNGSGSSMIAIPDAVGSCPYYSVTVTNHNSCIGIDTVHLCVTGVKPNVNFSYDSVCFGSPTHFFDASNVTGTQDTINGRKWLFYDNDSSFLINPSHLFSHDGVFNVKLNVTTTKGCNTSLIKPVTVFSIPSPNFTPLIGCSSSATRFIDGAHCNYGNIVNWHWEFDDPGSGSNDTSFQQNPIHNFDNAGTYDVLQRVVTNIGCVDSIRRTVVIKSSPDANYLATTTCVGTETFFADQTIVPPQDQIMEWHWKFGDGDSSTIKNPAHLYTSSGFYTAVMKVKSLNGCWAAMTKTVKIHAIPDAAFSTAGSCLSFGTQFTDDSHVFADTVTQWHWTFDNGDVSNIKDPLYIYSDTGIYNVSLTVKSNAGCADSIHSSIEVHSLPAAQFTFDPEYGDSPLEVDFYNQSSHGVTSTWDFGDGSAPSTDQNPVHIYSSDGVYKITLTSYNIYNCHDTVSYYIYVMPSYSDIMVKSVNAKIIDNKLSISAEMKNVGSRRLKHLEMTAHVSNENSIIEEWNGILSPGQAMTYDFSAKFYVSTQQTIDYVCVMADVKDDNTEVNKDDNEACAVLTDEFTVPNPYPNPAKDKIYITYIVPFEELVDIKLYDSKGSLVYTIFSGTAAQGFNKIALDISLLKQGVYAYKVVFRDKIKTNRFVKY